MSEDLSEMVNDLRPRLLARARLRTPGGVDPEDLVQTTLLEITRWTQENAGWTDDDVVRVAYTILQRRIIDAIRRFRVFTPLDSAPASREVVTRQVLLARVVRSLDELVAALGPEDSALLKHVMEREDRTGLAAGDRKRLERLRRRLRLALEAELGEPLDDVVAPDPEDSP